MKNWETAFEDWERLLGSADAKTLLQDPKSVWDEAWRQAVMRSLHILAHAPVEATRLQILDRITGELLND